MLNVDKIKSIFLEYAEGINHLEISESDLDIIAQRIINEVVNPDTNELIGKAFNSPHSTLTYIIEKIENQEVTIAWKKYSGEYDSTTYELNAVKDYIREGSWILLN